MLKPTLSLVLVLWCAAAASAQSPAQPPQQTSQEKQTEPTPQPSLAELARQNKAKKSVTPPAQTAASTVQQNAPKKLFSNDDMESPRQRRSLLELLEEAEAAEQDPWRSRQRDWRNGASPEEQPSASKKPQPQNESLPQEKDPEYYRLRLQPLRDELAEVETELRRLRSNSRYDYRTDSYVSNDNRTTIATISNSVKNDIERYESKRKDLQKRIAEIEEEASRNGVSTHSSRY